MALLSDLVAICAAHKLDGEPTLAQFARELREAGRVSKAGRGRGAAKMTYTDAARFLIACAATDHPKRAADAEAVFSNTLFDHGSRRANRSQIESITSAEPTLDLALAKVLQSLADGTIDSRERATAETEGLIRFSVHVSLDVFRSGVSVVLQAGGDELHYVHPAQLQMARAEHNDTMLALAEAWEREVERFRSGKNLHATLDVRLLRAVANAIADTPVIAERQTTVTEPGASAPGQIEDEA